MPMPSLIVFTLTKMYNTGIHQLYPQHLTFANATKLQLDFVQYVHESCNSHVKVGSNIA
jgi:hypothetical protein